MALRGEVALPQLISKLDKLATGQLLTEINRNFGEEAIELTKQGFESETAPSGAPWAPIQHRDGKILQDTARLKNSFFVGQVSAVGFRFGTNVKYASYHQTGTARMPKRQMVPEGELPRLWLTAFQDVADEILLDFFKT